MGFWSAFMIDPLNALLIFHASYNVEGAKDSCSRSCFGSSSSMTPKPLFVVHISQIETAFRGLFRAYSGVPGNQGGVLIVRRWKSFGKLTLGGWNKKGVGDGRS